MGWVLFLLTAIALLIVHNGRKRDKSLAAAVKNEAETSFNRVRDDLQARIDALLADNLSLQAYKDVRDVSLEAARIREETAQLLEAANKEADSIRMAATLEADAIRRQAHAEADELRRNGRHSSSEAKRKAENLITDANSRASRIVDDAEKRANDIAGDAYRALKDAEKLQAVASAMRNIIDGYGDNYLKPTYSILDELAENYGFDEAGHELKLARANSESMIASDRAAICDYVERNRRETAVRFVLDAFNGKVDTILGRLKRDNIGTLEQKIRDAFALVNFNGGAFRDARITPEYLTSRLQELKWAAAVLALKERDKEEQRRIREQLREEERAQREIERALKDAAKEEAALQRAMLEAQARIDKAGEEQRAMFEAQLMDLKSKLADAEIKNRRALSMAQQTKAGHVYVISNIGSFGEQVFKVGMTRRLEPFDRVKELGDASVPFPFDVHAMIWADDAPALENALHKRFVTAQINKVNPRKEFFRVPMTALREVVDEMGLRATWTLTAEASQYRETLAIEKELAAHSVEGQHWLRAQLEVEPEVVASEPVED